jgi:hypothetical protein
MYSKKIFLIGGTLLLVFFIFIILFSNHLINQQLADTLPADKINPKTNLEQKDQPEQTGTFFADQKNMLIDPEEDLLAPMKKEPKSTWTDPSLFLDNTVSEPSTKSPILVQ